MYFQELKENVDLAYRYTTAENREFWKSELEQAIRDIQQEYNAKVDQERGDMERSYNLKVGLEPASRDMRCQRCCTSSN